MHRHFRAFILLAVLLWQSLGTLGSWSVSQQVGELEHLIVHFQDADHHHHADNNLHMEDDGGPVQHMHADTGSSPTGILSSLQPMLSSVRSMSPQELSLSIWLSPTLEGPLRPPRQRA